MDHGNRATAMKRWEWLLFALGLTYFLAQAYFASPQKSASFDEQYHLAAGYAYLKTGDFRMSDSHPPLIDAIAALPLLGHDNVALPLDHPAWEQGNSFIFADVFLWQAQHSPQALLESARLPIMLLGGLLMAGLYFWSRHMFGPAAGWVSFVLGVSDPNLIANARQVTTDLGLTCLLFITMWVVWRWVLQPDWRYALVVGILAGLTMTSKFTGLLVVPLITGCILFYPNWDGNNVGRQLFMLAGVGAVSLVTLWAVYRFTWGNIDCCPIAVPAPFYWQSLSETFLKLPVEAAGKLSFLMGQTSPHGWWYYFPVAIMVKTPLPLLILFSLGLPALFRHRRWRSTVSVWLPPLVFVLLAMTGVLTIGYRHILPAIPFAIIVAGLAGGKLWEQGTRHKTQLGVLLGGMILWAAFGSIRIYPHHEAYFNEIAGHWQNWSRLLVDSNLDWGQDLIALQEVMDQLSITEVNLAYFGMAVPETYGIQYQPLPSYLRFVEGSEINAYNPVSPEPGWYAISATSLRLGLLTPETVSYYRYFAQQTPVARAGYSIYLYHVVDARPSVDLVVTGIPVAQAALDPQVRTIARWSKDSTTTIYPLGRGFTHNFDVVEADFEGRLSLLGYKLHNAAHLRPGTTLDMTLYWRIGDQPILSPAPTKGPPVAAFAHVTGDQPWQIIAQFDGWGTAIRGLQAGDAIAQRISVPIGQHVTPGTYRLLAGLYSPQSFTRMRLTDEQGRDYLRLTSITIGQ